MSDTGAVCSVCGERHPLEHIELVLHRPDVIAALSKGERSDRCKESDDLCAVWGQGDEAHRYFVRGVLPLPVGGRDAPYRIGAWVEIDEAAFQRIVELWKEPDQSQEPPFRAILANAIPMHESTLGLEVRLQLTGPTSRPDIFVLDACHTIHREQTEGISEHRAYEYTRLVT